MDALRERFESLGFTSVETFIASGNVIFEAPGQADVRLLERQIEAELASALGYEVSTFLRTPAELAAIASHEPFDGAAVAGSKGLYVGFLHATPNAESRAKLLSLRGASDDFQIHGRELYWLAREGMGMSKISSATIERTLGARTTMRSITTVRKLAEKYIAAP